MFISLHYLIIELAPEKMVTNCKYEFYWLNQCYVKVSGESIFFLVNLFSNFFYYMVLYQWEVYPKVERFFFEGF